MSDLDKVAQLVLRECLAVKPHEVVLVVTDGVEEIVAQAFYRAANGMAREAMLITFRPRTRHGEEPPELVSSAMRQADVVLLPTSRSLSHTRARREACAVGARIASMPMITREMATRTLDVDYHDLASRTAKYVQALTGGRQARLISPAGTDLVLGLEGRQGLLDAGMLGEPGASGNLPAGEAFIAPVEGTAEGVLVLDGSLAGWGKLASPIRIVVEKGRAVDISGEEESRWLVAALDQCGPAARNIAELGIGTNSKAVVTGNVLEDEKAIGTAHVALGDNKGMGGTVEAGIHLDGLVLLPTLEIDGRLILQNGKLLL